MEIRRSRVQIPPGPLFKLFLSFIISNIIMHKLRKPTNELNAIATTKEPLEEKRQGTRMATAREIVVIHCANTLKHMRDEKRNGADAVMLGSYTEYGRWWFHSRDPSKRPFYTFGPEKVAKAIKELESMDAVGMADQLLFIARRSVVEYRPAAEAAKAKLAEIGMELG
jgi:hypothetical protein